MEACNRISSLTRVLGNIHFFNKKYTIENLSDKIESLKDDAHRLKFLQTSAAQNVLKQLTHKGRNKVKK